MGMIDDESFSKLKGCLDEGFEFSGIGRIDARWDASARYLANQVHTYLSRYL